MKPLRARLEEARKRSGVPWQILERDYLLSWLLAGICQTKSLQNTLLFKGGSALRKCWFGDYRFSEDLDFTGTAGVPTGRAMQEAMGAVCRAASQLAGEYASLRIVCDRYTERDPHPGAQEAFAVHAQFPWQRKAQTRVMVEITVDEPVLKSPVERAVLHGYDEDLTVQIRVYALEEIVAEKLRAILQCAAKLQERGWSRSRARDYYDLWRVFGRYGGQLDLSDFRALLREKCAARGVLFRQPADFFPETMLAHVEKTWDQWLGPLAPNLPPYRTVIGELRPQVEALLTSAR